MKGEVVVVIEGAADAAGDLDETVVARPRSLVDGRHAQARGRARRPPRGTASRPTRSTRARRRPEAAVRRRGSGLVGGRR